jgi:uncharacterized low-complexity protein
MNTKTSLKLALGTTFAAGLALGAAQAIADNPFSAKTLDSGYMQLADNKAVTDDLKCGAGMCGGKMKAGTATGSDDIPCPADADKNGMVTKEEFMTYHEQMFTDADTNKDGSLDATERKALHSKMMEGKCGSAKSDDASKPAAATPATDAPAVTEEKK